MNLKNFKSEDIAMYLTIVLYFGSLALPGLLMPEGGEPDTVYGFYILLTGWFAMVSGIFSWWGYILGMLGLYTWLSLKLVKRALICFSIGLLLGLQVLVMQYLNAQINFIDSYNSWDKGMGELAIGYYVWIFSLTLLVIQSGIVYFRDFKKAEIKPTTSETPQ